MDLRQSVAAEPRYPPVLFFFLAPVEDGRQFFAEYWPEARAVADPQGVFYRQFLLGRAGWRELISPRVAAAFVRALAKGAYPGRIGQDPRAMHGVFLVKGRKIIWQTRARHIGDRPDFASVPRLAAADK